MIRKYSYIRVLLIGLPFGLACLAIGIREFREIPKDSSELLKVDGGVKKVGLKKVIDKESKNDYNVFFIQLENSNEYYSALGKHKDVLLNEFNNIQGDVIVTILHKKGKKYIEQLSVNGELLIEYKPPYWIAHFFFWLGVITLSSGLIYVIKHPEDLTGNKKKSK